MSRLSSTGWKPSGRGSWCRKTMKRLSMKKRRRPTRCRALTSASITVATMQIRATLVEGRHRMSPGHCRLIITWRRSFYDHIELYPSKDPRPALDRAWHEILTKTNKLRENAAFLQSCDMSDVQKRQDSLSRCICST